MLRPGPMLAAAALLCGGLRDPRLFALGGAAAWLLVLRAGTPLGPARAWLPWLGWAGLSALLCAQPLAALPSLSRWAAALAFASLAAAWSAEERAQWLRALGVCAVILLGAALWTGRHESWTYGPTMTGLLPPYYNYTAFVLAGCAAGGAALAMHPRSGRGMIAAGAAAAALGLVFALIAHSRGALLGIAAGGAVWTIRRWGARGAAAVLVAGGLAAAFVGPVLLDKSGRRFGEARPLIWRAAAEIASERPWLGEGPGSFSVGFRRHPVEASGGAARWGLYTEYAHSEPLQAAAETGWAGLGLWLLGLFAGLSGLARRASAEPAREAAAAGAAAMLVQVLLDNMLQIPGLAFLFLGAAAVADDRPVRAVRWPAWAAFAGCVLALTAWMPRTLGAGSPERAAALFPAEAERHEERAYALEAAGRPAEAAWARAAELSPFNGIYPFRLARLAAARGDWAAAEERARRAVINEPGFVAAHLLRAEALARLKRPVEALSALASARAATARMPGLKDKVTAHYDEGIFSFEPEAFDRVEKLLRAR
ncbi:MAG: O-antigen ligase family protein [Elusimicrobiota bacterium]|nr:MAG: O-antigen ligase family protein [Elusimicrobiota bacterium]